MKGKKHSEGFKQMILELAASGKPPSQIMREYGLSSSVYYKWINSTKSVTVE